MAKITTGMKNAMGALPSSGIICPTCSVKIPKYQGRYPKKCFSYESEVTLLDGNDVSIGLLEESGITNIWVYSINPMTLDVEVGRAARAVKTGVAKMLKVTLDNDRFEFCTYDHLWMLRNGAYEEAQNLNPGDSLMPLYTRFSDVNDPYGILDYEMVLHPSSGLWEYTHHVSDRYNLQRMFYKNLRDDQTVRHHKDFIKRNNSPDNMQRMSWSEHLQYHSKYREEWLKKNYEYWYQSILRSWDDERRVRVSKQASDRWKNLSAEEKLLNIEKLRSIASDGGIASWKVNSEKVLELLKLGKAGWALLWKEDEAYRNKMSDLGREAILRNVHNRREVDPEFNKKCYDSMIGGLQKLWKNPKHRKMMSQIATDNARIRNLHPTPAMLKQRKTFLNKGYEFLKTKEGKKIQSSAVSNYMNQEDNKVCDICGEVFKKNASYAGHRKYCLKAQASNHKIISIEEAGIRQGYDLLNVLPHHNFALSSGVFVHNCPDCDTPLLTTKAGLFLFKANGVLDDK